MGRPRTVLAAALALAPASRAIAQCDQTWLFGPGQGVPGVGILDRGPLAAPLVNAAIAWDPDGDGPAPEWLVVAGNFNIAGTTPCSSIAAWDGAAWHALGSITTKDGASAEQVRCLAVYNGQLIAGGLFDTADGSPVHSLVRWTGSSWEDLGAPLGGTPTVYALAVYDGDLYAGGTLASPYRTIARFDGSAWHEVAGGVTRTPSAVVYALAAHNGSLYVGGNFAKAGGTTVTANYIARWDNTNWSPVGSGFNTNGTVYALAEFRGDLIAGGAFVNWGNRIARWDESTWSPLGGGADGTVYSLAVHSDRLYAGGTFTQMSGINTPNVARWTGALWQAVGTGTAGPSGSSSGIVAALASWNGSLVAAGKFTLADGKAASRVAGWNGTAWTTLGAGLAMPAYAMIEHQGELVVGGASPLAGGVGSSAIARWTGSSWQPLGAGLGSSNSSVRALIHYNGYLIAGGRFDIPLYSGHTYGLARWINMSWSPLGTEPQFYSSVSDMTVYQGYLIASGGFTTSAQESGPLALYDGSGWYIIEGIGNGLVGGSLTVYNGQLIASGTFYGAPDPALSGIGAWDGEQWHALGSGVTGVKKVLVFNNQLIAGGSFASAGGTPAQNVAAWDGLQWSAMDTGLVLPVIDMAVYDGNLVALVGTTSTTNMLMMWNGSVWQNLGQGAALAVTASVLTPYGDELLVGGEFTGIADGTISHRWARWGVPVAPSIVTPPADTATCAWATLTLAVEAAGSNLQYRWRKDGVELDDDAHRYGSTGAQLTIAPAAAADSGSYDCVVSNRCDTVISPAALVAVCLADYDCNTFVTGDDFDQFIVEFEAGTAAADINHDGFTTGDDFDQFVIAFEAGC